MKFTKLGDLEARITGGTDGEGAGDGPVVVLLHGFGAPGDDLVPLWRVLRTPRGTRFVFPEGPVVLGAEYAGGRAWWWVDLAARLRRQAAEGAIDTNGVPDGLSDARAKLETLLGEIDRALRPPPGKLVLGGFSQGAMLSLDTALHSPQSLAGLVLMSGTHIAAREWAPRFATRRGLPVFMSHGQADEVLPFAVAECLRDRLIANEMPVEWVAFRGGHGIPPSVVDGVGAFLGRVLAADP